MGFSPVSRQLERALKVVFIAVVREVTAEMRFPMIDLQATGSDSVRPTRTERARLPIENILAGEIWISRISFVWRASHVFIAYVTLSST